MTDIAFIPICSECGHVFTSVEVYLARGKTIRPNVCPACHNPIDVMRHGLFRKRNNDHCYWHMEDNVPKFDPEAMAERLKKDVANENLIMHHSDISSEAYSEKSKTWKGYLNDNE